METELLILEELRGIHLGVASDVAVENRSDGS